MCLLLCWFPIALSAQSLGHAEQSRLPFDMPVFSMQGLQSLTQNLDTDTITTENSAACRPSAANSYFRRFDLDNDHSITSRYAVSSIDFAIEEATGSDGIQDLTISVHAIDNGDALSLASLELLDSAVLTIPDGNVFMATAEVGGVINANTHDLVVEVHEDGLASSDNFYIGSNSNGQISPSYVVAGNCGVDDITNLADVGFPQMHMIVVVHGDIVPAATDLSVSQTDTSADVLTLGDEFDYIIQARNNGPDSATGVSLVNTLNNRLSYLSNNCGASVNGNGNLVTWLPDDLATDEELTCAIRVRVDHFGLILNSVIISGNEDDPVAANDESTSMLAGPVRMVPILSHPASLILLMLLVGAMGHFKLRSKRVR